MSGFGDQSSNSGSPQRGGNHDATVVSVVVVLVVLALIWIASTGFQRASIIPHPNPKLTPGAAVTRDTARICVRHFSTTERPVGVAWTHLKWATKLRYGLKKDATGYQVDHLVPLDLGGAGADTLNTWPQPLRGPFNAIMKDTIDVYVRNLVCKWHLLSIDSAQAIMRQPTGWVTLYDRYHHAPSAHRGIRLDSRVDPHDP